MPNSPADGTPGHAPGVKSKDANNAAAGDALVARIRKIDAGISIFHVLIISLILATCSVIYHKGGMLHPEQHIYLPYYLSDKPILNKLYDSRMVDLGAYTARELSYFCDYIDARFIELSVSLGHPHFLSLTTYLFLLGVSLVIWHFSTRVVKLPALIGTGVVMLFWTSPSIFLAGNFFRSAKYGAALSGALLYLFLHKALTREPAQPLSKALWFALFFTSWIGTLFDRQGVYLIAMGMCFVIYWNLAFRRIKGLALLGPLAASLMLSHVYNVWLGARLTQWLNHYEPSFDYQQIPWYKLFDTPLHYISGGSSLYIDTLRFMFGNASFGATLVGLAVIIYVIFRIYFEGKATARSSDIACIGLLFCTVFLFIALNIIMFIRHDLLVMEDVRRGYYWVPQVTILSMTLALGIQRLNGFRYSFIPGALFLCLVIAGNLHALPEHQLIASHGHLTSAFEISPKILEALRNLDNPSYHPSSGVVENPVYQCLLKSAQERHDPRYD